MSIPCHPKQDNLWMNKMPVRPKHANNHRFNHQNSWRDSAKAILVQIVQSEEHMKHDVVSNGRITWEKSKEHCY